MTVACLLCHGGVDGRRLADMYRDQIRLQMHEEASRRLQEVIDPREDARVLALSLVQLVEDPTLR